ncbi:MAG: malto-oligosyltrehalose trehalohydrolase [Acidiphilium sp.]
MRVPLHGARMLDGETARFALWAPGCETVTLERDGAAPLPMARDADGWFALETAARPGTRYRYRVAPDRAIADPASRLQAGDVHGWSELVADTYQWRNPDWRGRPWHETVLIELHPGACGGYAGIETMLPRLAEIGFTAIELMPIADFPGAHNWGYDGVLPYAPDAAYGTPADLRRMIDAAHGHGLMVFLDVVYNHFGPDGNYLHTIAPDFFRDDIDTPWGSAIDTRREPVRRFFIDNAIYWLAEYRFDGLRFDAVHAIEDDDFLLAMAREIRAALPPDRHIHLVLENDDNRATLLNDTAETRRYDAQWADDTHHCFHILLTGEQTGYYEDYPEPATQLARCLAEGFAYQGEASPHRDGEPRGTPSGHLPPAAFVAFLQNHDQIGNRAMGERLTTLAHPEALRAAILVLLLSPQIPLVFMGEDYGETRPFLYFTDHQSSELAEAVRQGRRREFAKFAAFASEEARARIPDPNDKATFEASAPDPAAIAAAEAWRTHYRALLAKRHEAIIPGIVGARSLGATALGARGVRAAWRLGNGAVLTIAANFGETQLACEPGPGAVLAATGEILPDALAPRGARAWLAHR